MSANPAPPVKSEHPTADLIFVRIPQLIMGTLLLVAVAINLANVIGRYVMGAAVFWSEEVMIYLVIWCVYLAAITITYKGEHLNMDLFSATYPAWGKTLLRYAVNLLFIAIALFLLRQSWSVVTLHAANGTLSVAAGVPMVIPHAALPIGFVLIIVAIVYRMLTGARDGAPPPSI